MSKLITDNFGMTDAEFEKFKNKIEELKMKLTEIIEEGEVK